LFSAEAAPHFLRECLNPFTVEWAILGIVQRLSKNFRVNRVLVDEEEIKYVSHWYAAPKALCREMNTGTVP
jgi:hypothetical protein